MLLSIHSLVYYRKENPAVTLTLTLTPTRNSLTRTRRRRGVEIILRINRHENTLTHTTAHLCWYRRLKVAYVTSRQTFLLNDLSLSFLESLPLSHTLSPKQGSHWQDAEHDARGDARVRRQQRGMSLGQPDGDDGGEATREGIHRIGVRLPVGRRRRQAAVGKVGKGFGLKVDF